METGQALQLKTPIVNELNYQRNKVNRRLSQVGDQLKAGRLSEPERSALEAERETLCGADGQGGRLGDLVAMMGILEKWRSSATFAKLTPERQAQFIEVMHALERKYRDRAEDARSQLDLIEANARLGHLLAGKTTLLYLTLDLTFGSDRIGFFFQGSDLQDIWGYSTEWSTTVAPLARLSTDLASRITGGDRYFADTIQNGGNQWRSYLGDKFAMAAACGAGVVLPSVTLSTSTDTRDLLFTPGDTLENLDAERVRGMLDFADRFLLALLEHPDFPEATRPQRVENYMVMTYRYDLRRMDPFSVEIPTEPVRNAAVIAYPHELVQTLLPVQGQVAICQMALTDRQGTAVFRAAIWPYAVEAYGFSPDFERINAALDAGAGTQRLKPTVNNPGSEWTWEDHVALLFDCAHTDLVGLYNPSTGTPTQHLILLDAVQESSPEHYGIAGIKEDRTTLLPIPGDEGRRLRLHRGGDSDQGHLVGLPADQFAARAAGRRGVSAGRPAAEDDQYTSAKDIQSLNGFRAQRIEGKGVSCRAADELYAEAVVLVAEGRGGSRRRAGRGVFFSTSIEALSIALRSYLMVRTTTMDLIKAVAVFLALVIPFCLFLTKLVALDGHPRADRLVPRHLRRDGAGPGAAPPGVQPVADADDGAAGVRDGRAGGLRHADPPRAVRRRAAAAGRGSAGGGIVGELAQDAGRRGVFGGRQQHAAAAHPDDADGRDDCAGDLHDAVGDQRRPVARAVPPQDGGGGALQRRPLRQAGMAPISESKALTSSRSSSRMARSCGGPGRSGWTRTAAICRLPVTVRAKP